MAHDVFISYSNKDKTIADAVCARLEDEKVRCWMAPRDVPPGKDFAESVIDGIDNCRTFVLIWSVESNHSEHVLNEVSRAFNQGITVIPFRIENVEPTKSLEYYIGRTHWLDAITPPLEKHITKLTEIIKAILGVQMRDSSQDSVMDAEWGERKKQDFSAQDSIEEESLKSEHVKTGRNFVKIGLLMIGLVIVAMSAGYLIRDRSMNEFNTSTSNLETGVFIDDFTGTLGEGWTWLGEDKTHWQIISPNGLRITLKESGWYDGGLPHNLLLRDPPAGNYQIETRVNFLPLYNFQYAGLTIHQENNYLHLGRSYCDPQYFANCVGDGIYFDSVKPDGTDPQNFATPISNQNIVYLRLTCVGDTYSGYYSTDGNEWIKVGEHNQDFSSPRIGLHAGQSTVDESIYADFDYFKVTLSP